MEVTFLVAVAAAASLGRGRRASGASGMARDGLPRLACDLTNDSPRKQGRMEKSVFFPFLVTAMRAASFEGSHVVLVSFFKELCPY